jgi:hypothetical protein
MALARLYDFTAGQVIASGEVDGEFNQIVNALNGTSTNVNLTTRFSSGSVGVVRWDQLGAGPIAEYAAAGVVVASVRNNGSFRTAQQFISTLATGTKPLDVTSTTVCTNLNADLLDGIEAAAFALLAGPTFTGNITISSNAPELIFVDVNNSKTMRIALNDTLWNWVNNTLVSTPLSMNTTTDVFTFGQIPVLPAANPTTNNQAVRKLYVDGKFTSWSAGWFYVVPPSGVESVESVGRFTVPAGMTAQIAINSITAAFAGGSHTSGGTLTFTIKRRNAAGTPLTDVGTITINNSGPAIDVRGVATPGDTPIAAGDQIYPLLTTRSGTITEELITITIGGYQFLP